ncbi:MAG: hypothetical protein IT319_15990 [Anaerolineae bacterium]|nr:hypothetical protein [Anaerolineae bacterium]
MKKPVDYFLRVARTPEDLPAPVAEIIRGIDFPARTILIIPPQNYLIVRQFRLFSIRYGERTTPERTLVFGADRLLVIERRTDIRQLVIPYDALVLLVMGVELLYAFVQFAWKEGAALETLKVEYNAVGEAFVRAEVLHIRHAMPWQWSAAPDELHHILCDLPLKFRHYLRVGVYAGEQVYDAHFMPAAKPSHRLLRSRLPGDRCIALTSAGIMLLEEEADRSFRYSMTTRYFPLASLECIAFEPADDDMRMVLHLPDTSVVIALPDADSRRIAASLRAFLPSIPLTLPVERVAAAL